MLATHGSWDRGDWYDAVAPHELSVLYRSCVTATGLIGYPPELSECSRDQLATLRTSLAGRSYPD